MLKAIARAKVNPFLRVLPPRDDGFHDIVSLFVSIDLRDELTLLGTAEQSSLEVSYADDFVKGQQMDMGESNLVLKGQKLYLEAINKEDDNFSWHLRKAIPLASGLGGGSADSAAALLLLNEHYGRPLNENELLTLSANVGADVPFCLKGGAALVEGIGDVIEPLLPLPKLGVLLLRPSVGMATPSAYAALDAQYGWTGGMGEVRGAKEGARARIDGLVERLRHLNLPRAAPLVDNDFQELLKRKLPLIDEILQTLERAGGQLQFMTGSGSCLVAFTEDEERAKELQQKTNYLSDVSWCHTCTIASLGAELVETIEEG